MSVTAPVAIVTGTGRGLGEAIADELSDLGMYVVGCNRSTVDVRDPTAVRHFVSRVTMVNGFVDILVNNAGVLGPVGNIDDVDPSEFRDAVETNFFGPWHLMRSCLPHMKAQGSGRIINIGGGGADKPLPRRGAYACAKAALVRLTDTVAGELVGTNIAVNAVAPGPLATRMMDDILDAEPEAEKAEAGTLPIIRAAKLVAWLASPDSEGLTGRYISARFDPWPFDKNTIATIMRQDRYALRRAVN